MTGLCHRCGYFHSGPPEPEPTAEELAEDTFREDVLAQLADQLQGDREARDRLSELETKVDLLLDILMAVNESDRMGRIAKARAKLKKNPLLASIRKANQDA